MTELNVSFGVLPRQVRAVRDVSFSVAAGEIVGLVGESGSGKTVTALALMGLLDPHTSRVEGRAELDGQPLWEADGTRRPLNEVPAGMVFQEPMTALDPVFTIGSQLRETLRCRRGLRGARAREEAEQLLTQVGMPDPFARMQAYPHELSGGMRQRVVIALALAGNPRLLIADEPTTALDVTIQAQLLGLIRRLARERQMGVLLVTHDLGVIAETCQRVITLYAGQVVESGRVADVLVHPRHPYTAGLLEALPSGSSRGRPLPTIPGRVPVPGEPVVGCAFFDRCRFATAECRRSPTLRSLADGQLVRCWRAEELQLREGSQ